MRSIFWYSNFVFSLLIYLFQMQRMKRLKKSLPEKDFFSEAYGFVQKWTLSQLKMSGAEFIITGKENIPEEQSVLFVSNHQGNFDIAIFLGLIPTPKGLIAKIEMLKLPLIRTWMKYINCVFMDRSDIKKSAQAILDGISLLKKGYSMVVFPEGTRSKSSIPGEFKAGSLKLATKSKVPIIPVTIDGSYKIMEANNNRIKPARVYVTIHPPISTADLSAEEQNQLCSRVKAVIECGLQKA